ncbi:MAG: carboxypeptidase regulatory-like domain-containing protein [Planctomycetes bacterium]|nr:carboxypeptidase regulatory-like domain-containing protein [Planctomycetota bacterium]
MKLLSWIHRLLASRPGHSPLRRTPRRLNVEQLEDRVTPAALVESLDGTGNNLAHPTWGSDNADLLRIAPAAYTDGISSPAGANRPSARVISNTVAAQSDDIINNRDLSAFIYAWGQFIDHDLDLTTSASPATPFNILVPKGDPQFDPNGTGTQVITLNRANFDPATGTSKANPRQQVNNITAWLDGSMVYGSDATRAAALRTFSGGKMKTSDGNLLPFNTAGLANANDAHIVANDQLFLAGDVRANENTELTSLQTLFVREHNRLADQIATAHPTWTDEQIYQEARRTVIAELQAITYNEFLPALLGSAAPRPYAGYNPNVNPGIANEFSTAAFRVGHTLVGDDVEFLDNNGNAVRAELPLSMDFFNPAPVEQTGIDPVLKYLASDRAQEVDTHVVDSLRNFLFGPPGAGGLDLASLNIQRGRDTGLADYNTTRAAYGLPRVNSFADITSDKTLQQQLKALYGNVNNIDLWVGGLAENHLPGASVGPTFARIISDQFARLRDGDRFWYQRTFSGAQLNALEHTTLADIIRRNTTITNLQDNVFFFKTAITGRVFNDTSGDGIQNGREMGLAGRTVQLLALDGTILQTTLTRFDGSYSFTGLDLGSYKVHVVAPNGAKQTTPDRTITLTRGMIVPNVNLGLQKIANTGLGDPLA